MHWVAEQGQADLWSSLDTSLRQLVSSRFRERVRSQNIKGEGRAIEMVPSDYLSFVPGAHTVETTEVCKLPSDLHTWTVAPTCPHICIGMCTSMHTFLIHTFLIFVKYKVDSNEEKKKTLDADLWLPDTFAHIQC